MQMQVSCIEKIGDLQKQIKEAKISNTPIPEQKVIPLLNLDFKLGCSTLFSYKIHSLEKDIA
jgi:hypothetical protein